MTKKEILEIAKPILFNTEIVRAILDGGKTQFREAINSKYKNENNLRVIRRMIETGNIKQKYQIGDFLYVKEAFIRGVEHDESGYPLTIEDGSDWIWKIWYRADDELLGWIDENGDDCNVPWKPSIHMPKEYARIFLKITDARVERTNEFVYEFVYEIERI